LALMQAASTLTALEAAAVLADDGNAAAPAFLASFLTSEDPLLRRTAARALAREAHRPDDARGALADEDPSVRIAAAGALLAGAGR